MNRLTEFHNGIWGMSVQAVKDGYDRYSVFSELAEYENTGLTPEEIKNMQVKCIETTGVGLEMLLMKYVEFMDDIAELYNYRQAEEQGLLIKLPCKVGDMVYMLYRVFDVETGITREEIEQGVISELRGNKFNPIWYLVDCKTHRRDFHPSQIGKSVFLTREEAEEALKGGASE